MALNDVIKDKDDDSINSNPLSHHYVGVRLQMAPFIAASNPMATLMVGFFVVSGMKTVHILLLGKLKKIEIINFESTVAIVSHTLLSCVWYIDIIDCTSKYEVRSITSK